MRLGVLAAALAGYVLAPTLRERSGSAPWRYVRSSVSPGAVLAEVPAAVTVRLSDSVAAWSRLTVSAATVTPDGFTVWDDATTAAGRDSTDPTHRTLAAALRAVPGARSYSVEWTVYDPRRSREGRSGKFYFGVGAPVPISFTERLGGGAVRDEPLVRKGDRELRALATALLFILGAGAVRQWLSPVGAVRGAPRRGRDHRGPPLVGTLAHDVPPLTDAGLDLGPCPACGSTRPPGRAVGRDGTTQVRCRDCGLTGTPPAAAAPLDAGGRGGTADYLAPSSRAPASRDEGGSTAVLRVLALALLVAAFGACAALGSLLLAPFRGFGGG